MIKRPKTKIQDSSPMYGFDPKIGFWGLKNLNHKAYFDYEIENPIDVYHNSEGLREDDFKESNKESIICCGGSHTWGAGIEQNKRYSDLLKFKQPFDVVNMGHCSLGLDQVILSIIGKTEMYKPRIIIIEQYTWALHRVITKYVSGYIRPNFYFDKNGDFKLNKIPFYLKYRVLRKVVGDYYNFKKEMQEFRSGIDLKENYNLKEDPIFLSWKNSSYREMYRIVDSLIETINSYCNQKNIKLIFCLGPLKNQLDFKKKSDLIDYDLPHKKFISILKKHRITFLDTTIKMKKAHKKKRVIFKDGHLNEHGHKYMSDLLLEKIKSLEWI